MPLLCHVSSPGSSFLLWFAQGSVLSADPFGAHPHLPSECHHQRVVRLSEQSPDQSDCCGRRSRLVVMTMSPLGSKQCRLLLGLFQELWILLLDLLQD